MSHFFIYPCAFFISFWIFRPEYLGLRTHLRKHTSDVTRFKFAQFVFQPPEVFLYVAEPEPEDQVGIAGPSLYPGLSVGNPSKHMGSLLADSIQ